MNYIYQKRLVYFEKEGKGDPLILLHGWGTSSKTFQDLKKLLINNYTVYIIDLPGFGQSEEPLLPYTLDDYVDLIDDFIIKNNLENITLLGHSFGGRISIKYVAKNHNIKKLILVDSAGLRPKHFILINFKILLYKIKKRYYKITKQNDKYQHLLNHSGSSDYQNASTIMKQTLSNVVKNYLNKDIKKIKTETLIIWGKDDQITPLKDGKKMHKMIKSSGLVIINDCGHFPYLENPFYFNKVIKHYLGVK